MVSLLCHCCCRDLYIPNFIFGADSSIVRDEEYHNNIPYYRLFYNLGAVISRLPTPLLSGWSSTYIYISSVFYCTPGEYAYINETPFPLSPYDYIRIDFIKPEYLGVNVGLHYYAYPKGVYDSLQFSWSDFTSDKISEVLDILMNRFDPLFFPDYFYYSDIVRQPIIDYYAKSYSYLEFLAAVRAWLHRFFTDFYKEGCLLKFSSYGGNINNGGHFMIEKEPHTNANI